jgi:hypothetical protein
MPRELAPVVFSFADIHLDSGLMTIFPAEEEAGGSGHGVPGSSHTLRTSWPPPPVSRTRTAPPGHHPLVHINRLLCQPELTPRNRRRSPRFVVITHGFTPLSKSDPGFGAAP